MDEVDQVNRAELAMLTMFLQCKLACLEDPGALVCFVLVMKEAGTDLAEQQAAEDSCDQEFGMKPRFHW